MNDLRDRDYISVHNDTLIVHVDDICETYTGLPWPHEWAALKQLLGTTGVVKVGVLMAMRHDLKYKWVMRSAVMVDGRTTTWYREINDGVRVVEGKTEYVLANGVSLDTLKPVVRALPRLPRTESAAGRACRDAHVRSVIDKYRHRVKVTRDCVLFDGLKIPLKAYSTRQAGRWLDAAGIRPRGGQRSWSKDQYIFLTWCMTQHW